MTKIHSSKSLILRSIIVLLLCALALDIAHPDPAYAATIPVITCNASDLIAAINTANGDAAADTITLTAGCTYTFTTADNYWYGPNALPPISSTITLEGNGATLAIGGSPTRLRFFYVGADPTSARTPGYNTPGAGSLTLRNLTLTGGIAKGGDSHYGGGGAGMGGAIFNQGTLTLEGVTLRGNTAYGGNTALDGFGGGGLGEEATGESGGGFGGAVSPAGSSGGGFGYFGGGGGGFGPGDNGNKSQDTGGDGAGGGTRDGLGGGAVGNSGNGSGGGGFGDGGGMGFGGRFGGNSGYSGGGGGVGGGGGDASSTNSYSGAGGGGGGFGGGGGGFNGDFNGGYGNGGGGGFGGGTGSGSGGGGFSHGGGGGFGGGTGSGSGGGGGAGMGGAIFNHGGTLTITNSTLAANTAQGGSSYSSGNGFGGALFNLNGNLSIFNSTLAGNSASSNGGALYNLRYTLNAGIPDAQVTLSNSLLANNTGGSELVNYWPSNVVAVAGGDANTGAASVTFAAPNLVESRANDGGSFIETVTPIVGVDPMLAPLSDYGGSTQTFALLPSSPAIDAGAGCPATDQRGAVRNDLACDVGAFELKFADSDTVTKAISGVGIFTFGPTMVKVVVNDTGGCLTGLTIQRYNANHPNATTPIQTGHWWAITPSGCTNGFNVNLTLPTDFTPGSNDKLCRWNPGGPGDQWDCAATSFDATSVTRNNVTGFSDWAVGNNVGPTAIALRDLHATSPVAADWSWGLLPGLGVIGAALLLLRRRAHRA